jgi:hypothetical protein
VGLPDGLTYDNSSASPALELCDYLWQNQRNDSTYDKWLEFVKAVSENPSEYAEHANFGTLKDAEGIRTRFNTAFAVSNDLLAKQFGCVLN